MIEETVQEIQLSTPAPQDTTQTPAPVVSEQEPQAEQPKTTHDELYLAERFAELSRREAQLQKERQEAKAARERLSQIEQQLAEAKNDPDKLLATYGLNFEDLINHYANLGQEPTEAMKIRELERKLQEFETKEQEKARLAQEAALRQQQAIEQQALQTYMMQANDYVTQNAEQYELLASMGNAAEQIVSLAEEVYNATADANGMNGKIIGVDEAAKLLEEYYEEQLAQITKINKIKSKFAPPPAPPEPEPQTNRPIVKEPITLSNTMQITPKVIVDYETQGEDTYAVSRDAEARKRAEALIRKNLGWK